CASLRHLRRVLERRRGHVAERHEVSAQNEQTKERDSGDGGPSAQGSARNAAKANARQRTCRGNRHRAPASETPPLTTRKRTTVSARTMSNSSHASVAA